MVGYTEFVLRVMLFLLYEAYNNRIWEVSPDLIRLARYLDLETPLGSIENGTEAFRIMTVVESTRFASLPESLRQHANYESGTIGRVGAGADFVYYSIQQNHAVAGNDLYRLMHRCRIVPDGLPRWWD